MLAHSLIPLLSNDHELYLYDLPDFDITKGPLVTKALQDVDMVFHCAAYTNVDKAETDSAAVMAVNVAGTEHVAQVCGARDIPMVYLSTDYVFGEKTLAAVKSSGGIRPFREQDIPQPDGVYARSKYEGEKVVTQYCPRHYIVRTAWLYGINGKNFVDTMLTLARSGKEIRVVDDQRGCPTFAGHLAQALITLMSIPDYGIYHLTNQGETTWYAFTKEIFRQAGIQADCKPCTTAEYPRPAKRPAYSVLENAHWKAIKQRPLPPWQQGLTEYLQELKIKKPELLKVAG